MLPTSEEVTVYVPCYNAGSTLDEVLEGIGAQTVAPNCVLVVDDGSSEPLHSRGADMIRHATHRGLAAARNTALAACRTSLLASVDADVVPRPTWLAELLRALDSTHVAGVGGRLSERFQTCLADRWRAVHMVQHWGNESLVHPQFLFGANTVFRAAALRKAGGFEAKQRNCNADRIIAEALFERGYDLAYAPQAECEHLRRDTWQSVLRGYWKWQQANDRGEGDYDSVEGLISRVGRVNCGTFRDCFDLDRKAGRTELLALDIVLPWVFCSYDLKLFALRTERPIPDLCSGLEANIPAVIARVLHGLLDPSDGNTSESEWQAAYMMEFRKQLAKAAWLQSAHEALESMSVPPAELRRERVAA